MITTKAGGSINTDHVMSEARLLTSTGSLVRHTTVVGRSWRLQPANAAKEGDQPEGSVRCKQCVGDCFAHAITFQKNWSREV
jgi:hypothetical protein